MKTIDVILGSARSNSAGAGIYNYIKNNAKKLEKENEIKLNFLEVKNLPLFDEPLPPMGAGERKLAGEPKKWIDGIKTGDGYIFIEPVYDNGLSGAFKNALDYIGLEAKGKPAAIVSYSVGAGAGQASALATLPVFSMLGIITLPTITSIAHISDNFKPDGSVISDSESGDYYSNKLDQTVADVAKYAKILGK